MADIAPRDFFAGVRTQVKARLPAGLKRFNLGRGHSRLLKIHYTRPEIHFEAWHHTGDGRLEIGLNQALEDVRARHPGYEIAVTGLAVIAARNSATMIEKHLTLDTSLPGPDHRASLDPAEFRAMVKAIRLVESALGDGVKRAMPSELDTRRVARKSLVAARALKAGERVAAGDLLSKRPGTGISPAELPRVLGLRLTRDVAVDEVIPWEALARP